MLSKDRRGRLYGRILIQNDFDLPEAGEVYLGGMYRVVGGMLAVPADAPEQDGCMTVYALERRSNRDGQDRAQRARCLVNGLALVPSGELTEADIGKRVYPRSDDEIAATASEEGNQPVGTLLAIDGQLATVQL